MNAPGTIVDVATTVLTSQDHLNVAVLRDTCLEKTDLTVLMSMNAFLLMEGVATFVITPWDLLNAVADKDTHLEKTDLLVSISMSV